MASRRGPAGVTGAPRLVSQKFFEVELRPDGIAWLRRTQTPYETLKDVERAYDDFLATVDDWLLERRIQSGALGTRARTPMAWLYDLRSAPGQRNDPAFEAVIQARRADLLQRSPLLVVLVKTVAGRMQLTRLARNDKVGLRVSDDLDESLQWLLAGIVSAF
jgi:hypothetical protein